MQAFSRLRISGLTINPNPEEMELALTRLESMAAQFFGLNITTGYRLSENPDPNEPTGLRQRYWDAFESNLAVRLLSDFGKPATPELASQASASLSSISAMIAADNLRQVLPGSRVPMGDANTLRRRSYQRFYHIQPPAPINEETNHMYIGDINDYTESFVDYLRVGEFIESMEELNNAALRVTDVDFTMDEVNYQVEALNQVNTGVWQQLRIRIKTNLGRVTTRIVNFDIQVPVTVQGLDQL